MKIIKSNSGKQIICGLITLVVITLGMGIHTIREMRGLSAITAKMHHHPLTVGNAVRDVRTDIIAMHRSMKDVTLAQNPTQFKQTVAEVDRLEQRVFTNFDLIEERFLGDINDVKQARNAFTNWKKIRDEVINLSNENKFQQAALITTGKGADHVKQMDTKIQLMIDFANKKGDEFFEKSKSESKSILITTFALLLGALFTGIMVAIFITRIWRETEQLNKDEDWLKSGTNELNITMRGNQDQESLAIHIVTFLAEYLTIQIGALYIIDEKDKALHFCGGYGLSCPPMQKITPGQGLTGEVLRTGKQIITPHIPSDYFNIQSATGTGPGICHLTIMPFFHDRHLIGVIEFGGFTSLEQLEIDFLELSMPAIATTITASRSRLQLSNFLTDSRLRTKQLEQQEQKLTRANNTLGEKSIELSRQRDEIEQQNLELLTARTELEIRADKLARSSRYKSEFLANMSHELRTPLNSLLILSDSLRQNKEEHLSTNEVHSAEIIYDAGHELLTLINEILDLARIEAGRTEIVIAPIEICVLMDNIHSMFTPIATEKGLNFSIQTADNVPKVIHSDQFRLNQILKNLVGNAIKFTNTGFVQVTIGPPKTEISLGKQPPRHDEIIAIQIKDSGAGIAPALQHAVFEPFQQADGSISRQHEGTGLGLSISKKLASLLGGTLHLESCEGQGSTFSLYLPISLAAPNTTSNEEQETNTPAESIIPSTPYSTANILIIEDDPELGQKLVNHAQALKLHITLSPTYDDGMRLAQSRKLQAVLIDKNTTPQTEEEINKTFSSSANMALPLHIFDGRQKASDINASISHFLKQQKIIEEQVDLNLQGLKLLLVDDDMRHVFALSGILEQEEITVEIAENGKRALNKLTESPHFDVILMDIIMPELDGLKTIEAIRAQESFLSLPIIALTAKALTRDRQQCFRAGATDFLSKPIDVPELLRKIAHLCNRS